MGASEEVLEAIRAAQGAPDDDDDDDGFAVFADNWKTFLFFVSLQTRWKVVVLPNGRMHRVGLDWLEVESKVRRTIPRAERTALLELLEVLELEAVKVFNDQP